jgi:hypothetical protein
MLTIKKNGNWKLYWGVMPLPEGAEALGLVKRENLETGALIHLANGNYVQGNAGGIRTLPQSEIEQALQISEAAAALGGVKSEKKTLANRAKSNLPPKVGKKPRGRPKAQPTPVAADGGDSPASEPDTGE